MIRPMFGSGKGPRKFDMPLRYYDPKEDEKRRKRMRFKSNRSRHRAQNIRILIYAFGLGLVVWLIAVL